MLLITLAADSDFCASISLFDTSLDSITWVFLRLSFSTFTGMSGKESVSSEEYDNKFKEVLDSDFLSIVSDIVLIFDVSNCFSMERQLFGKFDARLSEICLSDSQ